MAIHFSIGGPVAGSGGLKPTVCATFIYDVEFEITVKWKGDCVDTSSCGGIANKVFCVPRGDYRRIIVNVTDEDGGALDISGFSNIEYVIAPSVDDVPTITKSLGSGIVLGGDQSSFVITLTEADTATITSDYVYHECRLTNGSEGQTVFAGFFRSPDTILGTD